MTYIVLCLSTLLIALRLLTRIAPIVDLVRSRDPAKWVQVVMLIAVTTCEMYIHTTAFALNQGGLSRLAVAETMRQARIPRRYFDFCDIKKSS